MEKRLFCGIKTKFIAVSTVIMAVSSLTWGGWFWYKESQHITTRLETEGRLLLSSMEAPIIDAILYESIGVVEENVGLLDNFVEQIAGTREPQVVYAFITDHTGRVISHSNINEFGQIYSDPLTRAVLSGHGFMGRKSEAAGAAIFDMAMPLRIGGKNWGALRVGVSMAPFLAEQRRLEQEILIFSMLFFLIGNGVFYLVGARMARPLKELSEAMVRVNYQSLDAPFSVQRRCDELGQLQQSFGEMLGRLKRTEQERELALAQLLQSEKLATIGKIVAGVAHEINNPLMVMSTSLFHLEKKAPQDLGRYLQTHKEGMHRIETIVRQLTDFSRVGTLDLQPVSGATFFRETEGFAGMALKKHDIRLVARDEAGDVQLSIDKGKLHQVVLNLLLNAADASPPGGVVQLVTYLEGGSYCLAIRDQGAGIAAENRDKIFEIFFTTKPGGEGTGIGLAISKSIVEMHSGSISFESRFGETTFLVRLPLREGT